MHTKLVRDLMIPLEDYPQVNEWDTLKKAMAVLEDHLITAAGKTSLARAVLVFNADKELVGAARRRDIMRGLEPHFLANKPLAMRKNLFNVKVDPNLFEMSSDQIIEGIIHRSQTPISEVVKPLNLTVEADDHMIKAIYEMVDNSITILPVLDDGEVVGIIRSVDVFHELAALVAEQE